VKRRNNIDKMAMIVILYDNSDDATLIYSSNNDNDIINALMSWRKTKKCVLWTWWTYNPICGTPTTSTVV